MNNLSIIIITLNEEKNIKNCLQSIIDLSDDIIVIDSGSTDKTEEICKNYKLRFITNTFSDYSSQKNYGNLLSENDYILSIDADECLSNELKKSILNLDLQKEKNNAYSFNRLNHHSRKPIRHGGWYPDKKTRIWNKNFGTWQGTIHEKLVFNNAPKIIHINGDLLHYTYDSFEEHIKQAAKFGVLNARKDFEQSKRTSYFAVLFAPKFRFISTYIFKLGFLDGYIGFFIAKTTANASFIRKMELLLMYKYNKK